MLNRLRPGPRGAATIALLAACVLALAAFYFFAELRQDRAADRARAADEVFGQVADQWDAQMRRSNYRPTTQDMQDFAETRNMQWGIVRLEGEGELFILQGEVEPLLGVVRNSLEAGEAGEPRWSTVLLRSGLHAGQRQATYAVPIAGVTDQQGREVEDTAIVFNRFYTEGDLERAG